MIDIRTFSITGSAGKTITADLRIPAQRGPLLIFIHGFKGFKDWGHFNAIADAFYRSGIAVLKFNFSHNGTTPGSLVDFADLDAFGRNTFSFELDDLQTVIDYCFAAEWKSQVNLENLVLLGHSRGGGAAVLQAAADKRVSKVITWAGVSDYEPRVNPPELQQWLEAGVIYQRNARTGQDMPLYISLRTDFYANRSRLDIPAALAVLQQPLLIVHGTADTSVLPAEAEAMKRINNGAELVLIEGADHTFGGKHPFTGEGLPAHTTQAIENTLNFISRRA